MRKIFALIFAVLLSCSVFAGGLVTNTNQSASFIRNPSRGASLEVDAAYFNPAGLTFLSDGFHFSISNQTITQERTIFNDFIRLRMKDFTGDVTAPLFPSVYAVYKINRLALSLGVMPIGGGGSAFYDDGLPSFEMQVAQIAAGLTASGIPTTQYGYDREFDGSSVFWGFQGIAAYRVTDKLSVAAGARYIMARNSYSGYLRHIGINPNQPAFGSLFNGTNVVQAPFFFASAATVLTGWSSGASSFATALQPIITGGGGAVLLSNGTTVGLTADQVTQIQGLITAAGQNPTPMTLSTAQTTLAAAAPAFASRSVQMNAMAQLTANKQVDATQKGSSIAPIFGLTFRPIEQIVVGFKYEHKAEMTLTNHTVLDDTGLFPDGIQTPSDMPSKFSLGVAVEPIPWLRLTGTGHYYLDRKANYGKKIHGNFVPNSEVIDKNLWEAAFGVELKITDRLLLSTGYLRTKSGVNAKYQSDLSHSLSTYSLGGGVRYGVAENINLNVGLMNTWYEEYFRNFGIYAEAYNRKAFVIALGVDFSL